MGLANHPNVIAAAKKALDEKGFGLASVRFICGTQDSHLELEAQISNFLKTEETILFSSCFDANGGVFETLLSAEDAIISDELNHASIIDGIRLSKAQRYRYANRDMEDLEKQLIQAKDARQKLIVTDGVFSMDGYFAPLREICDLAEKYNALVMVDDSHAVGFIGEHGRGTPELAGVEGRVDFVTGTLKPLVEHRVVTSVVIRKLFSLLRQRARPYLFSNTLPPVVVAGSSTAIRLVASSAHLRKQLESNAAYFRQRMSEEGFDLLPGSHPIVPVMFGEATIAAQIAEFALEFGVYVTAFSYPVVPKGKARIRVQLSAAHSREDIDLCGLSIC